MRQNRRTGGRRSEDDKIKYIRMAAIPLVIVVVLVIIIIVMDKKPSGEKVVSTDTSLSSQEEITILSDSSNASEDVSVEPDNNQYTTDYSQYELKKDEIPQVNQLISEYFQAKVDQDAETLYRIFGKTDDTGLDQRREELQSEAIYIEDYVDIVCYTKPGLTEESYVAYVTYEVKFRRVDTLAPGLMWCYIVKDDNGNYIIRENVMGDEADYVAKQNQSEDVMLLSNQVNERLRQAIEEDTVLAGIYKDLRNGAVVHASDAEDGEGKDSIVSLEDEDPAPSGADSGQQPQDQASGEDGSLNTQGEGIQAPPAGQPSDGSREGQGSPASEGGQDNAAASDGGQGSAGTDGGSSVKIE